LFNSFSFDNISFESLGEALSTEDCIDGRIDAKLESYSCKLTSEDKKFLGRSLTKRGASPHDLAALSPPTTSVPNTAHRTRTWSTSSANDETCLVGACSRRTLFYLQSTLNHSYGGDYDFSNVQSDEFSHEPSVGWVKNFIDSTLTAALSSQYTPQIKNQLWTSLEKEITLVDCEIFSFNPEKEPNDEERCMWSFTFFFFNKRLKRIVMFNVRAVTAVYEPEFYDSQESIDFLNSDETCEVY
jgi:hypothetical protein